MIIKLKLDYLSTKIHFNLKLKVDMFTFSFCLTYSEYLIYLAFK